GRSLLHAGHVSTCRDGVVEDGEMEEAPARFRLVAALTPGPSSHDALAAAMAAVWKQSLGLMSGWVTTIEEAIVVLMTGRPDPVARRDAERQAHKLAGSMGTFGRQRGSHIAREIERLLQGSEPLKQDVTLRLAELAVDLRSELDGDAESTPAAQISAPTDGPEILIVD